VDPHYGRRGCVLGSFGLRACSFGAGSSDDLLAVRIVSSFFCLHLAEFATREIIVMGDNQNSRPERMLDAGHNCAGRAPVLFANARMCIDFRHHLWRTSDYCAKAVEIAQYFTNLTSKRGVGFRSRDGGASLPC
jgi:hypothetical protein